MIVYQRSFIIKIFLWINLMYLSKSQNENSDNGNVEYSGADTELIPTNRGSNFEDNIVRYEGQFNSMLSTFMQLEEKINSLINNNMDLLEKRLQRTDDELFIEKVKLLIKSEIIESAKQDLNVHDLKCSDHHLPQNCQEVNECLSNIYYYNIMIPNYSNNPFPVVCDLKTSRGGWTIIQRRQGGSENFYRNWDDYVEGFGNMNDEFFIGLEKLHALTTYGEPQELYIILEDFDGIRKYANYKRFVVDSESTDYKINIGNYSGDAGDSFSSHDGKMFSTRDRDNDESDTNCAQRFKGGWWYNKCYFSNLNGKYLFGKMSSSKKGQGVSWANFRGYEYSLKFVQMMIRPKE